MRGDRTCDGSKRGFRPQANTLMLTEPFTIVMDNGLRAESDRVPDVKKGDLSSQDQVQSSRRHVGCCAFRSR